MFLHMDALHMCLVMLANCPCTIDYGFVFFGLERELNGCRRIISCQDVLFRFLVKMGFVVKNLWEIDQNLAQDEIICRTK